MNKKLPVNRLLEKHRDEEAGKLKKVIDAADLGGNMVHGGFCTGHDSSTAFHAPLVEALKFVLEKNYTDPDVEACREEYNVRAARTYDAAHQALVQTGYMEE